LEIGSAFREGKGPVLVGHTKQAGAAGPAVEPKDKRIVIGVTLRIKEDIVEGRSIEFKEP